MRMIKETYIIFLVDVGYTGLGDEKTNQQEVFYKTLRVVWKY